MQTGQVTLKKGNRLKLNIESLIFGGDGLARYKGMVVFVPFTAPGDEVVAEIDEVKKNFARARVVEIVHPSDCRIKPICPYFFDTSKGFEQFYCGGCVLQHIDYQTQLSQKTELVWEAATYIGKLKDIVVHDTIPSKNEFSYRNKMQERIGSKFSQGEKEIICGFYAPESHKLLDVANCYLQPTIANEIISSVKALFNQYELSSYEEEFHRGLLRHIIVRQSFLTREVMVIIVTRDKDLPNATEITEKLTSFFPQIKSIIQNINKKRTNKILDDQVKILFGKETIQEKIGHLDFKVSASSFFQVNTQQAEVLYNKIENFLLARSHDPSNIIIDVFSGTGSIALWVSRFTKKVYGVEVNEAAVRDAINSAELNNITNCEFRLGDAELVLRRMTKQGIRPDVIILDPPRKGCTRKLLDSVKALGPDEIIYVSCEATTLARDLHYLAKLKYKTLEIQPVDMFPQTAHIECVARVKKKNSK